MTRARGVTTYTDYLDRPTELSVTNKLLEEAQFEIMKLKEKLYDLLVKEG